MAESGQFHIEEEDIVRLDPTRDAENDETIVARAGWVNVGAFAVRIQLGSNGDLNVTVNPRTAEAHDLANLTVPLQASLDADGLDPDV